MQGFETMYRRFVSTPGDSLSLQVHLDQSFSHV